MSERERVLVGERKSELWGRGRERDFLFKWLWGPDDQIRKIKTPRPEYPGQWPESPGVTHAAPSSLVIFILAQPFRVRLPSTRHSSPCPVAPDLRVRRQGHVRASALWPIAPYLQVRRRSRTWGLAPPRAGPSTRIPLWPWWGSPDAGPSYNGADEAMIQHSTPACLAWWWSASTWIDWWSVWYSSILSAYVVGITHYLWLAWLLVRSCLHMSDLFWRKLAWV